MIVLGLDVSTSITGYCMMDSDAPLGHRLIEADSIIISHIKDPYTKAQMVRNQFRELLDRYEVDVIAVEENLQAFRRGLSSARTLSTLARFNGIVCFIAQDTFETDVKLLNVIAARNSVGLKIVRKNKEISIKEQVLQWIKNQPDFKDYDWPMKTLASGPRKGQTIHDKQCYDIADAAVICLSFMTVEQ